MERSHRPVTVTDTATSESPHRVSWVVGPTIESAIVAALALASAVDALPTFPAVRIGIHAGPAVERGADFFGAADNVAARVAALARSEEIACTDVVAAVAEAQDLAATSPLGTFRLKNVAVPCSLFRLEPGGPAGPSFGWLTWRRDHRLACRDWCTAGANCPRWPWLACPPGRTVEQRMSTTSLLTSNLTCPECGFTSVETMPTDACRYFHDCRCGARLTPKKGDCCVFCTYGDTACPPIQQARASGEGGCCRG